MGMPMMQDAYGLQGHSVLFSMCIWLAVLHPASFCFGMHALAVIWDLVLGGVLLGSDLASSETPCLCPPGVAWSADACGFCCVAQSATAQLDKLDQLTQQLQLMNQVILPIQACQSGLRYLPSTVLAG